MTAKPVILRALAAQDVIEAIEYYGQVSEQTAQGFINALEQALKHLSRHPAKGSPRYAHELSLAGLRSWPLTRYPYLVFYIEQPKHLDVWRVFHSQRDIPNWMLDSDS